MSDTATLIEYPVPVGNPSIRFVTKSLSDDVSQRSCEQNLVTTYEHRDFNVYHVELVLPFTCNPGNCPFDEEYHCTSDCSSTKTLCLPCRMHRGILLYATAHGNNKIHQVSYTVCRSELSALLPACMPCVPDPDDDFPFTCGGVFKFVDRGYGTARVATGDLSPYNYMSLNIPNADYARVYMGLVAFLEANVTDTPTTRRETRMCCAAGYNYLGGIWLGVSALWCCIPRSIRRVFTIGARRQARGDTDKIYSRRSWFCSELVAAALDSPHVRLLFGDSDPTIHPCWMSPHDIFAQLRSTGRITVTDAPRDSLV